jgi:hypothetical protein
MFEPNLFPAAPAPMPEPAPVEAPAPIVIPQFVPVAIKPTEPPKPPKPPKWPAGMVMKAQGLYPQEAMEKAARMDQAKAPPAPTGAWGKPQ